jgi:hypothetical protein
MKKIIYIGVFVLIAGILGYLAFSFFFRKSSQETVTSGRIAAQQGLLPANAIPSQTPADTSSGAPSITDQFPKTPTLMLGTNQGAIEVNNFYLTIVDTEEGSVFLKDTDDYRITYRRNDSIFRIELYSPSITVRHDAEAEFLNLLNISQTDACKLNVEVIFYRTAQDGQSSPLSFCFR